jgi:hypothetical protein
MKSCSAGAPRLASSAFIRSGMFFRYCLKQFMLTILEVVVHGGFGAAYVFSKLAHGGGSVPILNEQLGGHINDQFSLAYSRVFNACQVW